ncbi:hypothetical protein LIER_06254 [Lithospermum erythrorhizon]|uniref:Uncharacterized protein n=1 Tax=Lithospermum erythrorhizon TaxID=34254 RepID=A0AAV3P891_LITER
MNYQQRLVAAANYVYAADSSCSGGRVHLNAADYGITAELKPHQIEGVSWLVRRYHLGVNVILGDEVRVLHFYNFIKQPLRELDVFRI